ncbi:hypothetical protein QBC43DRAFT_328580 [Cladorrhinum sp. PSN259]|nr:hypothetical protein QBC43DRAFT_328580 [Cladorrhinum sp. PSN259]
MEPFAVLEPTHLRSKHRYLSAAEMKVIVRTTQQTNTGIFRNQADLELFILPQRPVPAVPELAGPYFDGLKCDQCSYIARQVRLIQEHCRIIHGWSNPRTRGGNAVQKARLTPGNPWRSGVPC